MPPRHSNRGGIILKETAMKDYLVVTAHPALPDRVRAEGPSVGEAWKKMALRNKLTVVAAKIEALVTRPHGGKIVYNGSGYGIAGNKNEFNDMICVRTTDAGLVALKKIRDVGRISETIDFNNLQTQPDGVSNVPPGVSWTRP
jgi:hypothetical protein